jgi:hypothetical protein
MGFLNLFSKPTPAVQLLPSGSLTVDRHGQILATTVSSAYDPEILQQIANLVLRLFRDAAAIQMPLSELTIHFGSLQISAREMRGGAMVFLSPKHTFTVSPQN